MKKTIKTIIRFLILILGMYLFYTLLSMMGFTKTVAFCIAYAIFAGALFVYVAHFIHINKQFQQIVARYDQDGNNENYLKELTALGKKTRIRMLRDMIDLNRSGACLRDARYQEAFDILNAVKVKKMSENAKVVYYVNLITYYRSIEDEDKAQAVFYEQDALFQKFRSDPNLGVYFELLECDSYASSGKVKQAREHIEKAHQFAKNPRTEEGFLLCDIRCDLLERNFDRAEKRIEEVLSREQINRDTKLKLEDLSKQLEIGRKIQEKEREIALGKK
ncbi:MAG: hypothetical protein PUB10_08850 [Clostridiales bacterium]|nr:hypothetical protein [Clostridiales bacterium]